jgi:hypothetical protein
MAVRLSALRAGRAPFTPQEHSWYLFLLEAESTKGHSAAGRIRFKLQTGLWRSNRRLITDKHSTPLKHWKKLYTYEVRFVLQDAFNA